MSFLLRRKVNRIALISVAAAVLLAGSPVTAFAAEQTPVKVTYTGNGATQTVLVENADNLDAFTGLMPSGSTKPQEFVIQNNSAKQMRVYFQAQPGAVPVGKADTAQKLLDTLQLNITFKMDDNSAVQTLYSGPASGKTGSKETDAKEKTVSQDIATSEIPLGFVYGNSQSGKLTATLTAPETMGNEFQDAAAQIKWDFQFELADSPSSGGGNSGGGDHHHDGGSGIEAASIVLPESIPEESTPQVGVSSSSSSSVKPSEPIPEEGTPLSKPPKTGETPVVLYLAVILALIACVVFVAAHKKSKSVHNG